MGVYYRDLVIYDPNTNTVEFFPLYKNILDTTRTTNSHSKDESGNLEETAYFLKYRPDPLTQITWDKQKTYPEFYKQKEAAFRNIASVMFRYTLENQQTRSLEWLAHKQTYRHARFYKLFSVNPDEYLRFFEQYREQQRTENHACVSRDSFFQIQSAAKSNQLPGPLNQSQDPLNNGLT